MTDSIQKILDHQYFLYAYQLSIYAKQPINSNDT